MSAITEDTPTQTNHLAIAAPSPLTPAMLRPIAKPEQVIEAHKEAVAMINECLEDGVDYGTIPGTGDKKNLLKPGAERLAGSYGIRPEVEIIEKEIDHNFEVHYSLPKWVTKDKPSNHEELKAKGLGRNKKFGAKWSWQEKEEEVGVSHGLYRYVLRVRGYDQLGREVGQGVGSCSSMEAKYVRNPRDSENTVFKIAKKRGFVDMILTTLGLSDRFTQDVEDIEDNQNARHSEPGVHPVEEEAAAEISNYLVLERKITKAESDQADAWLKECGFNKETYGTLKAAADKIKIDPRYVLLEGKRQGIKDPAAITKLLEVDENKPIDAEFTVTEEPTAVVAGDPKAEVVAASSESTAVSPPSEAPASTPEPASDPASTSLPASDEYDPFADTKKLEIGADEDPRKAFYALCDELNWPTLAVAATQCLVAYKQILGRTITGAVDLKEEDYRGLANFALQVKANTESTPAAIKRWQEDQSKSKKAVAAK